MNREQLERYLANPNVRKMLDLISYTEGTQTYGARTAFGGARLDSLKDHPRYKKSFTKTDGTKDFTSAAGKYQFLRGTWDDLASQYGFSDFGEHNQDLGAVALLVEKGAIEPLLQGDFESAVRRAGPVWASLPTAPASYKQPTKSWQKVNEFLGGEVGQPQGKSPEYQMDSFEAEQAPESEPFVPFQRTVPDTVEESLLGAEPPPEFNPLDRMLGIAKNNAYTKPGEKTPLVASYGGLAYPENETEFDLFSNIKNSNLSAEEEPAVVAVGEALTRAKNKQASESLIDTNPLIPLVGDLFDMAEV